MTHGNLLFRGRQAFHQQDWKDAYVLLSDADKDSSLSPEDLELLAITAHMTGRSQESNEMWTRAHHDHLNNGKMQCAIRCAFWLGFGLLNKGEFAHGSGWLARANRLLEQGKFACVEEGYLQLPIALRLLGEGDARDAMAIFEQAGSIGEHYQDADLMTLSRLGRGQCLVRSGERAIGTALLDEAMADVESGDVSPMVSGIVYCAVIEVCMGDLFDIRRAQEWTGALSNWCNAHPQLVPFRGQCLIRRSEVMQLHGAWNNAEEEILKAIDLFETHSGEPAAGTAFYRLAELHRLRGDPGKAEEVYRQAGLRGKDPRPGLALLRLAQDRHGPAGVSIRQALKEAKNTGARTRLLPAFIEIMLAMKNVEEAWPAVRELNTISADRNTPLLKALAAYAEGAILLAGGDPSSALDLLRDAVAIWESIEVPYEAARARTLTGIASRGIGDEDSAEMELGIARSIFEQLDARPDIANVDMLLQKGDIIHDHGLSPRELDVLMQIAGGGSNKDIASKLCISERTVDRHVSNILVKLDVSSRSGATAYAYKHQLIQGTT